jgi:hypothetical protein
MIAEYLAVPITHNCETIHAECIAYYQGQRRH